MEEEVRRNVEGFVGVFGTAPIFETWLPLRSCSPGRLVKDTVRERARVGEERPLEPSFKAEEMRLCAFG